MLKRKSYKDSLTLTVMKCELCKEKIDTTFLAKPVGTAFKDAKGKQHWACAACQRGKTKEELLAALK